MNDQDLLRQLDDRAARAAVEVHARAAARTRPAFDPGRPLELAPPAARPSRLGAPRRVLAVAAAVVLLAGAAGWWATAADDDDAGPATSTDEGLRPHVATDLPAGLAPAGAFHRGDVEPDDVTGPGAAIPAAFYGPADDDPQLAVAPGADLAEADEGLGAPVDLGGGLVARPLGETFGLPGVLVTGTPEPVILLSRSLSTSALGEIAPAVRFDGGRAEVATDALPDGWRLRTREPDLLAAAFPMSASGTAGEQYGAAYVAETEAESPEVYDRMAIVLSLPGDDARRATARLLLDDAEDVEVQGRPALVGRSPDGGDPAGEELWTVAWLARPGTLVRVSAYGLDRSETLRVAEGVRAAEGGEWDELERLTEERVDERDVASDQPDGSSGLELGRGTFPDGTAWVLRTADGGIGTELTVADGEPGGSSSSTGEAGAVAFRSFEVADRGDRVVGSGLLAEAVAAVELRRPDGTVIGRAEVVAGSGDRAWVAELGEDPVVVVALDAAGRELDRRDVEAGADETVGDGVDGGGASGGSGVGGPVQTTRPAGSGDGG